jgi:hypothetical protein
MNKLPSIIKELPESRSVLNCNVCYDNGLRNKNVFRIYDDKKFRYYVCYECESIHRIKRIKEVLK